MYQDRTIENPSNWQRRANPVGIKSSRFAACLVLGAIAIACSDNGGDGTGPGNSVGGGTGASTGGNRSTGGSSAAATGGSTGSGVGGQSSATTGGSSASATGGAATGGKSSSAATGGAATGGKSSSAATGGAATGGKSSSAATGGAATGGKSSSAATGGTDGGGASSTGGTANAGGDTSPGGTGTTGGATSNGGSTGGGAVMPTAATVDTMNQYQFTIGDLSLVVNPTVGARVTYLKLGTTNIIQPNSAKTYDGAGDSNKSGITFWTSPQSAWGNGGWPPVTAIDGGNYTVTDNGAASGHLVLTSSASSDVGASVIKDISADSGTGWITIKYTIKASKAIQVAPWQIARVPRAGLIFFPCTTAAIKSPNNTWTLTQASSYDWIDDKNQSTSSNTDGTKYVNDATPVSGKPYSILGYALGGNLFLTKYPDVEKAQFATGEGDTEIYPGPGFIELEAQGEYKSLAASETLSWTIQMRVVQLPSSVTVASGSATLISFAEEQAAL